MKKLLIILILIVTPLLATATVFQDPGYFPYDDQVNKDADYFDVDPIKDPKKYKELYTKSCIANGSCSLDQGFNTFVILTKWGLGMLGSISLLFFIVGGFMWLTSGGKADQITKGKNIMLHTVIGIIIVLSAWIIVQTVLTSISKKTLQGLGSGSQTEDLCKTTLNEGDSCRGNLGICQSGSCVAKCNAAATRPVGGDYQCREYTACEESSIIRMYCFGANNIVCCAPKIK